MKYVAFVVVAGAATVAFPSSAPLARAAEVQQDAKQSEHLANQAYEAYSNGDYQKAITLYQSAYKASPTGVILFNLANIYDKKLKQRSLAIEHYRKYIQSSDTDSELVERAHNRIITLRREIDAEALAATSPASPSTSDAPLPRAPVSTPGADVGTPAPAPYRAIGLALGGAGLLGIGVGAIYGLKAGRDLDAANERCRGDVCSDADGVRRTDDARSAATISTVAFASGGVLLGGGLLLYLLAPQARGGATAVAPMAGPSSCGLLLRRTW